MTAHPTSNPDFGPRANVILISGIDRADSLIQRLFAIASVQR
jgi:hypothetical protein